MTDPYIYAIVALLPISVLMLVLQSNPYNALILRGILGAIGTSLRHQPHLLQPLSQ